MPWMCRYLSPFKICRKTSQICRSDSGVQLFVLASPFVICIKSPFLQYSRTKYSLFTFASSMTSNSRSTLSCLSFFMMAISLRTSSMNVLAIPTDFFISRSLFIILIAYSSFSVDFSFPRRTSA